MSNSARSPFSRNTLSAVIQACLPAMLAVTAAHAGSLPSICTVSTAADDPATAAATAGFATTTGTLRDCILVANLRTGATGAPMIGAFTIELGAIAGQTITLAGDLPLLFNNTVISDSNSTPVTIDGGNAYRIFMVSGLPDVTQNFNGTGLPNPDGAQSIAVAMSNLILQGGRAHGGNGSGGGLGAGGALFVNQNASLTLNRVSFAGNGAVGGDGATYGTVAGGGGMAAGSTSYGGGGIGGGASNGGGGGIGTSSSSSTGGGFGGTGIGQISNVQGFGPGFNGGAAFAGGGIGGGGGQYGFGGFGGGGGENSVGGFGGGGGGGQQSGEGGGGGGAGGFGGGGGTGSLGIFGFQEAGGTGGTGAGGGFGAGGGGGGGGGNCYAGYGQSFPGGNGGSGGSGGIGAGAGGSGAVADGCTYSYYAPVLVKAKPGAGGGGAGFGGAVFVRSGGTLTLQNDVTGSIAGGSVTAGGGNASGAAAGSGLFLMTGATTTFDVSSTYTISDSLADDSASSLPGGGYTAGNGAGAGITKQGVGTLVLSAADNSYAGATTINAGTLQLDGTLTASAITINGGGALAGTGTAQGVTLNSGGAISPGDSPGTLHLASLTWNSDSAIAFQLGATTTPGDSDLIELSGALTKGGPGTTYMFHFSDGIGAPALNTTYTLITFFGATGFVADDFSYDYVGANPTLVGTFAIVDLGQGQQALQFTATTTPVRLQSFEVD